MTFKTFTRFIRTGTLAKALDSHNKHFKYSLNVNTIKIEKNQKTKFSEVGLIVRIKLYNGLISIPLDAFEKIRLPSMDIKIYTDWSSKLCDFMQSLDDITFLRCFYPRQNIDRVADFFKKTRIQKLKMIVSFTTSEFLFDTSNIDFVEIYQSNYIHSKALWSIKARRRLTLHKAMVTIQHNFAYIEKVKNQEEIADLTLVGGLPDSDHLDLFDFLWNIGIYLKDGTFGLQRSSETHLYMCVDMLGVKIHFRKQ